MRSLLLGLFASIAFVASACANASEGAGEANQKAGGAVDVRIEQVLVSNGLFYTEGSYSYVRVAQPDGGQVVKKRLARARECSKSECVSEAVLRLAPGEYRFVSFQRPCDGSCELLDPPTDRCDALITVKAAEALDVVITVRPGEGCKIEAD